MAAHLLGGEWPLGVPEMGTKPEGEPGCEVPAEPTSILGMGTSSVP